MGERRKPRIKMVVPVRIWGMDSAGKPFNVLGYTLNVSATGARIGGVKAALGVGDAVTVQYKQKKALFKVAWIGRPGDKTEDQIGVALLEPEREIWSEVEQPTTFIDDFVGRRTATPITKAPEPTLPPPAPVELPAPVEETEAAEDPAPLPTPVPAEAEFSVEVTTDAASSDPDEATRRLARGLLALEQLVKRAPPSEAALEELRDAVARIRQTAWALQQWHQTRRESGTAFPLLAYLNSARLRFLAQAAGDLADDIANNGVEPEAALLSALYANVDRLRKLPSPAADPAQPGMEAPSTRPNSAMVQQVEKAVANITGSALAANSALDLFSREVQRIVLADGVAVARFEDGEMVCVAASGSAPGPGMVLETETGIGAEALSRRELVYCPDTQRDPRVDADLCRSANIGSVVIAATFSPDRRPAGMIQVTSSQPHRFDGPIAALNAAAVLLARLL
jgi:hypothetical protein